MWCEYDVPSVSVRVWIDSDSVASGISSKHLAAINPGQNQLRSDRIKMSLVDLRGLFWLFYFMAALL